MHAHVPCAALNLPAARPLPWDGEADLLLTPPMDTGDLLGPLVPLATCLTSLTLSAPMACSLALDGACVHLRRHGSAASVAAG